MPKKLSIAQYFPTLPEDQVEILDKLAERFEYWNGQLNLSAIRDPEGILMKHVVDSLLIQQFDWIQDDMRVMDLGTGGGFPGLALAAIYPQTEFILVDSTEKKVKTVETMAEELGLSNVGCFIGRAEDLGQDRDFRAQFDVVVARALAGFSTLMEFCLPFVSTGGKMIAYQGPDMIDSWQDYQGVAKKLSAEISACEATELPDEERSKRCFVVVDKVKKMNPAFPRRNGIPKKTPLTA